MRTESCCSKNHLICPWFVGDRVCDCPCHFGKNLQPKGEHMPMSKLRVVNRGGRGEHTKVYLDDIEVSKALRGVDIHLSVGELVTATLMITAAVEFEGDVKAIFDRIEQQPDEAAELVQ